MSTDVAIHAFARPDRQLLARVEAAHTPDLANVLGPRAVADAALRPVWRGGRVLGPALTVKLSPCDNLGAIVAVMEGSPGDVIVVQAGEGEPTAIAGALAVRAARERGIAGMIIDGAVRDTRDLEAMGFPVWARYVCPRQSSKDQPAQLGVPITCGGVEVAPGDIVIADDDGVVFASPAKLAASLEALDKVLANEKRWQDTNVLLEALGGIVTRANIKRL